MPDHLEINDLSHLSDEEFRALCPIGEHAPGPEPLSPAAQAVKDAFDSKWAGTRHQALVAALCAVADQVVPPCSTRSDRGTQRMMIRHELLAIAAELEGSHD